MHNEYWSVAAAAARANQEHVVIARAEQQLTIGACSAESTNAAIHAQTVSCLVTTDQNMQPKYSSSVIIRLMQTIDKMQL